MKVEEKTDCKRKLEQKKSLQRQLRDIEKLTDMDPIFRDRQKEKWKEELQLTLGCRRGLKSCRVQEEESLQGRLRL